MNRFRIYVNFGKALIDKAVIGINGPDKTKVPFDDKEAIRYLFRLHGRQAFG
ncbi:MAG: hypothetical protein ABSE95_14385 [Thermodesulfobacteriota bacterium]